jgi:hypothetical protein
MGRDETPMRGATVRLHDGYRVLRLEAELIMGDEVAAVAWIREVIAELRVRGAW